MTRAIQIVGGVLWGAVLFVSLAWAQQAHQDRYLLKVSLDPEGRVITGTATVDYTNDSSTALSNLYFLLMPNYSRQPNPHLAPAVLDSSYWSGFDPAWTKIFSVKTPDGQALEFALERGPDWFQTYSLDDTVLRIALPQPLAPGETVTVVIDFETKFPHITGPDEGFHSEIFTWRFGWSPIPVPATELRDGRYVAPRPYYKFVMPAALYEMELTLPTEYVVAAGGDRQTEEPHQELKGQKIVRVTSDVPVRSIPISISDKFKKYELTDEIPIVVYYRPGHEANARLLATYAHEILGYYQEHFGPYDYKRLVLVEASSDGYFGMAADGFIILGSSFFFEKDLGVAGMLDRLTEYVLAHEMAHQWWGIGIGADLNAENFLSEAFAEYLSITYFEEKYGEFGPNLIQMERSGLLEKFIQSQLGYLNLRRHFSELPYVLAHKDRFDEAIVKPQQDVRYANYSAVRLYNKGYLVLRALRGLLGHETMNRILQTAHERWAHRVITVGEFEALVQELSGRDFSEFFAAWLHRDDDPALYLDYAVTGFETTPLNLPKDAPKDSDRYVVRVFLERKGPVHMPVTVVAVSELDEEFTYTYESDKPTETWEFRSKHQIKEVRVDPNEVTPDVNRLNNYYPQRTRVITNGDNDLPLDAYLVRMSPLGQTIEIGFLNDYRIIFANGYVGGWLNLGRGTVATAALSIPGTDIFGFASLSWRTFAQPTIGYRGVYWVPQEQFVLTVARLLDAPQGPTGPFVPVVFAAFDYQRSEFLKHLYVLGLSLRQGLDFTQLSLQGITRLRVWPNVYLDVAGDVGLGFNTQGMFRFNLSELSSFKDVKGFPFTDRFRWLGYAELNFPLQREMGYNLLNLALMHQIDQAIYVLAARTAPSLETWLDTDNAKVEAGLEFRLHGTSLGGLLPFTLVLRLSYPLVGAAQREQHVLISIGVALR
jgi:hypothetical protein